LELKLYNCKGVLNMLEKLRTPALVVAILGAVKLVTDAFGLFILDDVNINAIANGVSAVVTVIGICINRSKPVE
jgi:uncharacterized membrane protein